MGSFDLNMGACEGREAKFDNDQKEIMKERFSALDSDGNGWLSKHEMQDDELYDIITAMGGSIDSEKGVGEKDFIEHWQKIALSEDGDSIKWTKVDVATKELVKKHQKNMASKSAMDGIVMNMQLRMQIDPNVADNEQRKILSSLFRVLDADTDGFVTRDELNAGNESLQNQKVVAKILEIFDKLDSEGGFQESDGKIKPGDGKLSMEEWHAGLEAAIQDVGWEGDYSIETLCNILTPENMAATLRAKADAAFDKIDANKDGKLTCKEMTEWCKKNPDAAKSLFGLGYCLQPSGFGLTNKQYEDMFGVKQGKGWSAGKEDFIKKYMEFLADSWPGCLDEQTEAADGEAEPAAAADKAAEEEATPDKAPKTKEEFAAIMQAMFNDIDDNGNGDFSFHRAMTSLMAMGSLIREYVSVPAEYENLKDEIEAVFDANKFGGGGHIDLERFTKCMSTIALKYGVISGDKAAADKALKAAVANRTCCESWNPCCSCQIEAETAARNKAAADKAPKTKEEFAAIMQALFTDIDANGDGVMDRSELSKDQFKMMFRKMESLIREYVSVPAEYTDAEKDVGLALDAQMSYIQGGKFDLEAFTKCMSTIASKYGVISDGEAEPAAAADKAAEEEAPPDKAPKTKEEFAASMQALFTYVDENGNGVMDVENSNEFKGNFKVILRTMGSLIKGQSIPADLRMQMEHQSSDERKILEAEIGAAFQAFDAEGGKFDLEGFTKCMSTIASKYGVISAEE